MVSRTYPSLPGLPIPNDANPLCVPPLESCRYDTDQKTLDSGVLHNLPTSGKQFLLDLSSPAAHSIITHGKQEAAFEDVDRSWRRWTGFLARTGYRSDPFLLALSPTDSELIARAFFSCVRNFKCLSYDY